MSFIKKCINSCMITLTVTMLIGATALYIFVSTLEMTKLKQSSLAYDSAVLHRVPAQHQLDIEMHDRGAFQRHIAKIQNPKTCDESTRRWVYGEAWIDKHGLFNQLLTLANTLLTATAAGRTLINPTLTQYVLAEECESRTFDCYFEPLSSCTKAPPQHQCANSSEKHFYKKKELLSVLFDTHVQCLHAFIDPCAISVWHENDTSTPIHDAIRVMAERAGLLRANRPARWFVYEALEYITRPNKRLRAFMREAERASSMPALSPRLGYRPATLGLHVRQGDKSGGMQHPFEEYAIVSDYISKAERLQHVMYGSDNQTSYEFFPSRLPELVFHYLPEDWFVFGGASAAHWILLKQKSGERNDEWKQRDQNIKINRREIFYYLGGLVMLAQTLLMSECEWVVCTTSSAICQFIHVKMMARLGGASLPQLYDMDGDVFDGCGWWWGLDATVQRHLQIHSKHGGADGGNLSLSVQRKNEKKEGNSTTDRDSRQDESSASSA